MYMHFFVFLTPHLSHLRESLLPVVFLKALENA
jgi:hypothetical protein